MRILKMLGHKAMNGKLILNKNIVQYSSWRKNLPEEYDLKPRDPQPRRIPLPRSQTMLDFVFANTSERFGPLHGYRLGADASSIQRGSQALAKRIFSIHLKDFEYHPDGGHHDVVIGKGFVDLPALIAELKAINFKGYMAIEYEGEPENPIPALIAGKEEVLKLI